MMENYITAYSDPFITSDDLPQANPESTIWLEKFDDSGEQIFLSNYFDQLPKLPNGNGNLYTITEMIISNDAKFLITGYIDGVIDSGFLIKVSQDGELLWYRFYSPPQAEGNDAGGEYVQVYGVTQTSDNGYIMAGEYFSSPGNIFPEGIQTAIAVKVDEYGCLEPGCQIADAIDEYTLSQLGLEVYPNPATNKINVSVDETIHLDRIRIYNVMGSSILEHATRSNSEKLDVSDLSPGVYLIEVSTKDHLREVKRVVIE
jgi:hypothetical protein